MEARQTLRGSAVPKALLIVLALCAAAILALGVSFMTKGLPSSGASVNTSAHPAAGTVLRQDWDQKAWEANSSPAASAKDQTDPVSDRPGFRP